MAISSAVIIRPGREKSLYQQHRWIFSGSIESIPEEYQEGDVIDIRTAAGDWLGRGWFRRQQSLAGRVLTFQEETTEQAVFRQLQSAWELRRWLFNPSQTNGYRLVNAEADGLPGLIVDIYHQVAVVQSGSLGTDKLLPLVVAWLRTHLDITAIYEKSTGSSRAEEKLEPRHGWLWGDETAGQSEIIEDGRHYIVDVEHGQKTGFFLDQRAMRTWVEQLAKDRSVLNLFGYTGGFSVAALRGGAQSAVTVDLSAEAIALAKRNCQLNGFAIDEKDFIVADVIDYLQDQSSLPNLVVVDPPAFAKKRDQVANAMNGYRDLNRLVLSKVPSQSLVVTCSCSYFVDETLFTKLIFQAALAAQRNVRILSRHHSAPDHLSNIYHPESGYLKSLTLWVE
jgi:23S rRNA (cytosine1962-C5)-methyltransferase